MTLKSILEYHEFAQTISVISNKKTITVPATKGTRIYIGFLELIFGVKYSAKNKKLDLTSLKEDIDIEFNDNLTYPQVALVYDIERVSKILESDILNKLENYYHVKRRVTMVDDGDYENISIQDIMFILAHYDMGIEEALNSSLSDNELKKLTELRDKFYNLCKKYFEMSGKNIHRFGHSEIVTFVKHVMDFKS